jgi:hypothetical protein
MIMEEVMYGVMLNAKIDMDENDPPVIALKKPNTSVVCFANQFAKNDVSIPGIGSWQPNRMTTSIIKV